MVLRGADQDGVTSRTPMYAKAEVTGSKSGGHTVSLLFQAAPLAIGVTLVTLDHRLRASRFSAKSASPGSCFLAETEEQADPTRSAHSPL